MGSGSSGPVRAGHELVGLALGILDDSEPGSVSRCRLERPADLFASTLHHCIGFPSEEVGTARILFTSVLGRTDPVRMIIANLTVWLNFVSGDIGIVESYVFALYDVNIVV